MMFDYLGYDWTMYLVPDGFYGGYDNCTDYNDVKGIIFLSHLMRQGIQMVKMYG